MGMLSKLAPSAVSEKSLRDALAAPGSALSAMREHPVLSKALTTAMGIAFPPARAGLVALEVAQKVQGLLQEDRPFAKVSRAWQSQSNKGLSLMDQIDAAQKQMGAERARMREGI